MQMDQTWKNFAGSQPVRGALGDADTLTLWHLSDFFIFLCTPEL